MSGLINSAGSKSGVIGQTELDYEEGYWTAASAADNGTLVINTATDQSAYTKIGRLVHVQGQYTFSTASATGDLTISGLPFTITSLDENAEEGAATVYVKETASDIGTYFSGYSIGGGTSIRIRIAGETGIGNYAANFMDTGTSVWINLTYAT